MSENEILTDDDDDLSENEILTDDDDDDTRENEMRTESWILI